MKKVVSVVLFVEGERILIQDRRLWDKYGFDYGFFGGKIGENETPEQALERELREELNIHAGNFRFFKHVKKQIPEADLELEVYLYVASLPDIDIMNCKEGKPFLTDFKTALELKFNPVDLGLLREVDSKLNKK